MKNKLLMATAAWIAMYVIGTIVSIAQSLAFDHPFWGAGDADTVARDWLIGGGTALVAPAAVLVVVLFAAFLLLRDGPASMVGAVLLAAVALLNTIGALGETITWEAVAADTFDVIRAIPAWGSVIAGMFMWAFAIAELAGTRRVPTDRIQSSVERELAEHTS